MKARIFKQLDRGLRGWERGLHDVTTVRQATKTLSEQQKDSVLAAHVTLGSPAHLQQRLILRERRVS